MEQFVITATTRKESGKKAAAKIREAGKLPAVAYNEKGESIMLEVNAQEFSKAWRSITKTTLVNLKIDGKDNQAFIKDTEYDIKTDKNLHADFHLVSGTKPVTRVMKIHYVGTAAGVLKGGFMVKHTPEIKVKCLPKDMPVRVVVDVTKVNIGDVLCVKDVNLGDNITVLTPADASLVSVAAPR